MRRVFPILFLAALVSAALAPAAAQDRYFSGSITAVSSDRITVSRTALGETSTRTFAITPETRIDGNPEAGAKVTVQFRSAEGADRATHIIVRSPTGGRKKG